MEKRVFSGVQPTGDLHLGNYLGAIAQFVKLQDSEADCLFCIVDLHAITAKYDKAALRRHTLEIAAAYHACGIRSPSIFVQSHVPGHAELGWLLQCVARVGWLDRMTQFREKTNSVPPPNLREVLARVKGYLGDEPGMDVLESDDLRVLYDMLAGAASNKEKASVGLYTYPVLMAADILAYKATHVPVGIDQIQHLNLARDIAEKFNKDYSKGFFPLPEALIGETAKVQALTDASKKMSKSDPDPLSRINLSDSNDEISRKIRKATADTQPFPSTPEEIAQRGPEIANLIGIYRGVTGDSLDAVLTRFGGQGYGVFKPALAEAVVARLSPIRDEMLKLVEDENFLWALLQDGADRARDLSEAVVEDVKAAMGLL